MIEIESGGILVEHVKGDLSFNVSKKKKKKQQEPQTLDWNFSFTLCFKFASKPKNTETRLLETQPYPFLIP